MNRREFIGGVLAASVAPAFAGTGAKPEYHAFSRVFQFLKDPYKAADFLKSCGYDGVEWTVRKGGFLDPDTATADGMKALRSAADKAGIEFACAGGETLLVTELQAPGKKRMSAAAYLLGHPIRVD